MREFPTPVWLKIYDLILTEHSYQLGSHGATCYISFPFPYALIATKDAIN